MRDGLFLRGGFSYVCNLKGRGLYLTMIRAILAHRVALTGLAGWDKADAAYTARAH
jgi:hypothetical protein